MSAIHATALSTSNRFTIMQKVGASASKRNQQVLLVSNTGASVANRSLLNKLEQKHQMRTTLRIKRVRSQFEHNIVLKDPQTSIQILNSTYIPKMCALTFCVIFQIIIHAILNFILSLVSRRDCTPGRRRSSKVARHRILDQWKQHRNLERTAFVNV